MTERFGQEILPSKETETRPQVLVLSKNSDFLNAIATGLSRQGFSTACFEEQYNALYELSKHPPDLFLFDQRGQKLATEDVPKITDVPYVVAGDRFNLKAGEVLDQGASGVFSIQDNGAVNIDLLGAQIRAILRRHQFASLTIGDLTVDLKKKTATIDGEILNMKPVSWAILEQLSLHSRLVTKKELVERSRGCTIYGENYIKAEISLLRRKLGKSGELVRTIYGVGYTLVDSQSSNDLDKDSIGEVELIRIGTSGTVVRHDNPMLLIIDSDSASANLIRCAESKFVLEHAINKEEAEEALSGERPDLVIISDKFKLIADKRESGVPYIYLTDRPDKVVPLIEDGADNCYVKPFNPDELIAFIRTDLNRRKADRPVNKVVTIGDLTVNLTSHIVEREGRDVSLTGLERRFLEKLILSPENAASVAELSKIGRFYYDEEHAYARCHVRRLVSRLRKKMGEDIIETVPGRYKLNVPSAT